jgi:hypothetical protein
VPPSRTRHLRSSSDGPGKFLLVPQLVNFLIVPQLPSRKCATNTNLVIRALSSAVFARSKPLSSRSCTKNTDWVIRYVSIVVSDGRKISRLSKIMKMVVSPFVSHPAGFATRRKLTWRMFLDGSLLM